MSQIRLTALFSGLRNVLLIKFMSYFIESMLNQHNNEIFVCYVYQIQQFAINHEKFLASEKSAVN